MNLKLKELFPSPMEGMGIGCLVNMFYVGVIIVLLICIIGIVWEIM